MEGIASRIVVPLAVVIAGSLVGAYLIGNRPEAHPNPPVEKVRSSFQTSRAHRIQASSSVADSQEAVMFRT